MNRNEYTVQVLANLRRVTKREREAIRAELDAHMEDHICDLLDLGYSPELAEERTMALMGDPAEVGRELNRQYPLGWLVLRRAAMALTLIFILLMAVPAWRFGGKVADNLWNRFYPLHQLDMWSLSFAGSHADGAYVHIVADTAKADLKQTDGGVTLWVYQVGLEDPAAEKTTAWAAVSVYSQNPFHGAPRLLGEMTAPDGEEVSVFGSLSFGGAFLVGEPVKRGEDMCFTYEQTGHRFAFTVPLPWEEAVP